MHLVWQNNRLHMNWVDPFVFEGNSNQSKFLLPISWHFIHELVWDYPSMNMINSRVATLLSRKAVSKSLLILLMYRWFLFKKRRNMLQKRALGRIHWYDLYLNKWNVHFQMSFQKQLIALFFQNRGHHPNPWLLGFTFKKFNNIS